MFASVDCIPPNPVLAAARSRVGEIVPPNPTSRRAALHPDSGGDRSMAIYRFEGKIIGRKQGKSATASAAYRAADRIVDERTGQAFDYGRKRGVLHSEILAPDNAPEWMRDRAQLWNAVERVEKRKDAQLARDFEIALPHELTHEQRLELVRGFVREEFVDRGMIADLALHAPDRAGDARNYHAHVMLTMRDLVGDGFGNKAREWNDTELLEEWREHWANAVNRELERYGLEARVDHRSLADQGIDREPEPKLGPIATEMEREGRPSHAGDDRRAVLARNAERAALETELSAVSAEIIDLEEERARRAQERPPQPLEVEPSPAPEAGRSRSMEPGYALSGGDSILSLGLDAITTIIHEGLYVAGETAEEMKFIAGAIRPAAEPQRLTDFVAAELERRGDEPPPREYTAADYVLNPEARRAYREQRQATEDRGEALDQLRQDIEAGRHLGRDAVLHLSREDLINIRAHGDDALRQMIDDREREEKRWRDDDYGRERER